MTLKLLKTAENPAPKHLKAATRAWFQQISNDYDLESQHLKILLLAAEAWDVYLDAAAIVREQGFSFVNKKHGDIKSRPEVAIMQNSRLAFLRCLRELNLDVAPPETPRPNTLKYPR